MKKVAVIGHYAYGLEYLDGQTIKTKIITKELEKQLGKKQVHRIDTYGGKKALPKLFFKTLGALFKSKNIVIMPAHNGLKFFVPVLNLFNKIFRKKLYYIVIGGWLASYLEGKKGLERKLKKFNGIFVETSTMKRALDDKGFTNVYIMPNCKELNILSEDELVYPKGEPYKLCTFSRVCKEKGIEDAVNAVIKANEHFGRTVYALDIYGQVDSNQTEWFEELQKTFPEYVNYGGLVPFDKSVEVLKDYFALLFPTYYEGECFAGTIIDAYASGILVVASDWKYNPEIIKDGVTGYLFETKNVEELKNLLVNLFNVQVIDMKKECLKQAKKFLPENVIKCFMEKLG